MEGGKKKVKIKSFKSEGKFKGGSRKVKIKNVSHIADSEAALKAFPK